MRKIGFLTFPDCSLLDVTGPMAAFSAANMLADHPEYQLDLLSETGGALVSGSGASILTQAIGSPVYDSLMVCGGRGPRNGIVSADVIAFVREAEKHSRRIASVCTGAFVLAAAGLLNGKKATTHWRAAATLQKLHPLIKVDSDRIFINEGKFWTSAGISAGIDLALALIEEDLGTTVSRDVARQLVVYHRRPGGQSQFSAMLDMDAHSNRIRQALSYARAHLQEELSVERLAEIAFLGRRQFSRAFLAETGETPAKAIERLRAEAAKSRIENGRDSLLSIARAVGFSDPERMRRAFLRVYGQPPQAIRRLSSAA